MEQRMKTKRIKKGQYKWLDRVSASQLKYAAKRININWIGMERSDIIKEIRDSPRRAELREVDVRHLRPPWEQLLREIDWERCGWNYDWYVERVQGGPNVYWPSHLLHAHTADTSKMLFARDALKMKWANMAIPRELKADREVASLCSTSGTMSDCVAEQALRVVFGNIKREELVSLKDPVKHVFDKFTFLGNSCGFNYASRSEFDEAMKAFLRKCTEDSFTIAIIGRRTDLSQITHPALDRYFRRSKAYEALDRIHSRVISLEGPLECVYVRAYSDLVPDELDRAADGTVDSAGTCITVSTCGHVELYFFDFELEKVCPLDAALIKFPEVEAAILNIDAAPDALLEIDGSVYDDEDSVVVTLKSSAAETV